MILNWIIAFLGLAYFFAERLNSKKIANDFSIKYFLVHNAKDLIRGFLAVTILMLVFVNKEVVSTINDKIDEWPKIFQYIPYAKIASLIIGMLNYWIMTKLKKKAKAKISE